MAHPQDTGAASDFSLWGQTDFTYQLPYTAVDDLPVLTDGQPPPALAGADYYAMFAAAAAPQPAAGVVAKPGPAPARGGAGAKRPPAESADNSDDEDPATDEKRRRNSAASARFRLKKKLKEQTLEQNARILTERAEFLSKRVKVLEAEVAYLRELLIIRRDRDREAELSAAANKLRAVTESMIASPEGQKHNV